MSKRFLLALIVLLILIGAAAAPRLVWPGILDRDPLDPVYAVFETAEARPVSFDLMIWGQVGGENPEMAKTADSWWRSLFNRLTVLATGTGPTLEVDSNSRIDNSKNTLPPLWPGDSSQEAETLLREALHRLQLESAAITEVYNGPFRGYEAVSTLPDGGKITITVKKANPKTGISAPWVFATLHRDQPGPEDAEWQRKIKSCLNALGVCQQWSVAYTGVIDRCLGEKEQSQLLNKMLRTAKARNKEITAAENLLSATADSPLIDQSLTVGGQRVNLNLAVRSNNLDKKTFVTVGSPLIATDY